MWRRLRLHGDKLGSGRYGVGDRPTAAHANSPTTVPCWRRVFNALLHSLYRAINAGPKRIIDVLLPDLCFLLQVKETLDRILVDELVNVGFVEKE